ncbi:hypothetical protein GPECTOR_23g29 [Gonium pectorale]|uniref:Uncharacterized protein n=1 Tax=Gonium pectorale TaxID=33097 RepID=A0A150GH13_GONPE|nr:hypothetical protein GPECTOR_23g29 [Gonium pectorale]|eukprot:KXZ49097.1 hypothetical protein GPECTOR_23g29 [Gonium pectorale]
MVLGNEDSLHGVVKKLGATGFLLTKAEVAQLVEVAAVNALSDKMLKKVLVLVDTKEHGDWTLLQWDGGRPGETAVHNSLLHRVVLGAYRQGSCRGTDDACAQSVPEDEHDWDWEVFNNGWRIVHMIRDKRPAAVLDLMDRSNPLTPVELLLQQGADDSDSMLRHLVDAVAPLQVLRSAPAWAAHERAIALCEVLAAQPQLVVRGYGRGGLSARGWAVRAGLLCKALEKWKSDDDALAAREQPQRMPAGARGNIEVPLGPLAGIWVNGLEAPGGAASGSDAPAQAPGGKSAAGMGIFKGIFAPPGAQAAVSAALRPKQAAVAAVGPGTRNLVYSRTPDPDGDSDRPFGFLTSVSARACFHPPARPKSHEELRWEDHPQYGKVPQQQQPPAQASAPRAAAAAGRQRGAQPGRGQAAGGAAAQPKQPVSVVAEIQRLLPRLRHASTLDELKPIIQLLNTQAARDAIKPAPTILEELQKAWKQGDAKEKGPDEMSSLALVLQEVAGRHWSPQSSLLVTLLDELRRAAWRAAVQLCDLEMLTELSSVQL